MAMIDLGCSKIFSNNISLQLEGLYVSKKVNNNCLFNLERSYHPLQKNLKIGIILCTQGKCPSF